MDLKKYKRFVRRTLPRVENCIAIAVALLVIIYLFIQSFIPMSTKELTGYNEKLELLKKDFSTINNIEGVRKESRGDTITVTFDGRECDMQAVFDKNGTYMYRVITDDRVCTNFGRSCLLIILVYASTRLLMLLLQYILIFSVKLLELRINSKNKQHMEALSYEKQ